MSTLAEDTRTAPAGWRPRLRPYQQAAVEAVRDYLRERRGRSPVVSVPTGGGKSHLIAELAMRAADKGNRVLILTHRRELLRQNRTKLQEARPDLFRHACYFSAGLAEKRLDKPIVFAGVQSLARVPELPAFDLVLIDEAHRVPSLDREGQYRDCIEEIRRAAAPREPVWVGLSATPYRMGEGWLWDAEESLWDGCAYETDMMGLVANGWLSPLRTVKPDGQIDVSTLKRRGGEFTSASLQDATAPLVEAIAEGAWRQMRDERRRGMMVFCPTLKLVEMFRDAFVDGLGVAEREVLTVDGDDPAGERDGALLAFKREEALVLVSCGVLTEGFDAPHVDMIVVARAIASPGLWVQVCGRGMRVCEGKDDCVVRDHGSNLERLGPVNAVTPVRFGEGKKRRPGEDEDEDGGGDEGGGAEKVVVLSLDPSRGRMLVRGGIGEFLDEDWQVVTGRRVELATSARGNRMMRMVLELEGKPSRVPACFLTEKSARSWQGRAYSRMFGQRKPDDEQEALEVAREAAKKIRRVVVVMNGRYPQIRHVERGALNAEERR